MVVFMKEMINNSTPTHSCKAMLQLMKYMQGCCC